MKNDNIVMQNEELDKLKSLVAESIAQQRSRLLMKHKFIGGVVMHLEMIPVRDNRVDTAMTDGKHIYFDIAFYSDLSNDERLFIIAHEAWHCVYMHMLRKKGRDQEIWNLATDMEINRMLVNDGFIAPAGVLFPEKKWKNNDSLSAEEMYELLLKDIKSLAKKQKNSASGNVNDINDIFNGKNGNQKNSQNKNGSSGKYDKDKNVGKSNEKFNGQFDDHIYANENKDSLSKKKITDKYGEVGEDPDFNPSVSKEIAERMREIVLNAAEHCKRMQGNLPAGIESYINELRKPVVSWQEYLTQFVTVCLGDKRQWLPANRRHIYNEIYLQSRRSNRIEGVIAIDTSGSCINDLPKFFGELKGLMDSFGNYKLTVIQADAAVDKVDEYDSYDNPFETNIANNIGWSGGGGTDYGPVFKYIDDNELHPDFLIYMGDGYAGMSYSKKPNYPVLWLLTTDVELNFCDFGQIIRYNDFNDKD